MEVSNGFSLSSVQQGCPVDRGVVVVAFQLRARSMPAMVVLLWMPGSRQLRTVTNASRGFGFSNEPGIWRRVARTRAEAARSQGSRSRLGLGDWRRFAGSWRHKQQLERGAGCRNLLIRHVNTPLADSLKRKKRVKPLVQQNTQQWLQTRHHKQG